jgi:membrane protein implicated in regulation of membrane protease activity
MFSILYFWIATALLFLVVEFWTSTFYGLALSLAAGIVALYVFFSGEMELSIVQGIIFAVASLILAYTLPRVLSSSSPDVPQGFDRYIGEKRTVKKSA